MCVTCRCRRVSTEFPMWSELQQHAGKLLMLVHQWLSPGNHRQPHSLQRWDSHWTIYCTIVMIVSSFTSVMLLTVALVMRSVRAWMCVCVCVCVCVWSMHNFVILYCRICSVLMPLWNFSFWDHKVFWNLESWTNPATSQPFRPANQPANQPANPIKQPQTINRTVNQWSERTRYSHSSKVLKLNKPHTKPPKQCHLYSIAFHCFVWAGSASTFFFFVKEKKRHDVIFFQAIVVHGSDSILLYTLLVRMNSCAWHTSGKDELLCLTYQR